jgi:hypothetical protein
MITAWIGSIVFFIATILYVLLALGLPYGEFAMGGKYKVMPNKMRIVCVISIIVQLMAILVLLEKGTVLSIGLPQGLTKGTCIFFAIYLSLNTLMNAVSKSKKERLAMTPLSLVTAVCFWITAFSG